MLVHLETSAEDSLSAWAPVTHMGDPQKAPDSWVQAGPASAIVATGGANEKSLPFLLTVTVPLK